MDVESVLREALDGWQERRPPAALPAVARLRASAGVPLPDEYLFLLLFADGGEGDLGAEPGWFRYWPADDVLASAAAYGVPVGLFGFGTNGGNELLAFDTRGGLPYPVVMVPLDMLDPAHVVTVANDPAAFLRLLGQVCPD